MVIRRGKNKDIDRLIELLQSILELHAGLRPDIFVSGTAKYTKEDLEEILKDDSKPVYVATNENDDVIGYAFCQIKEQPASEYMVPFRSIYIDDLCVDGSVRGCGIGKALFEYVKGEAKRLGCYEVTLNVWTGNDTAEHFYEKMGMKVKEKQMEYIL